MYDLNVQPGLKDTLPRAEPELLVRNVIDANEFVSLPAYNELEKFSNYSVLKLKIARAIADPFKFNFVFSLLKIQK